MARYHGQIFVILKTGFPHRLENLKMKMVMEKLYNVKR